jgi:hypothetical protein
LAAFVRRAKIPFHAVPSRGKPTPGVPHLHIKNVNAYHSHLKQWLNCFNGVATKNLPNYLVRGALSKPGATNSNRQTGSKALSETAHTNRYRYKSQNFDLDSAGVGVALTSLVAQQEMACAWNTGCSWGKRSPQGTDQEDNQPTVLVAC